MEGDNESTPLLSDRTMGRSLSEGARSNSSTPVRLSSTRSNSSTPVRLSSTRSNSTVNLLNSFSRQRSNTDEVTPSNLSDNALVYDNKEVVLYQNGKIDSSIGEFSHLRNIRLSGRRLSGMYC
jgi:hypothetical protein